MKPMNLNRNLVKAKIVLSNLFRALSKKSALINLNLVTTNLCNQHCPMCNTTLMRDQKNVFTLDIFKRYIAKLKSYNINMASCTISGGEPTLVKELPEIIEEATKHFPFGILLITNLYGNTKQIMKSMEAVLKNGVNLSISFDGFDDAADKLRGSKGVSKQVMKHIEQVKEMQIKLNSTSKITLHTVVADLNIDQIPELFEYSKKLGWKHTIAPVNIFYYQEDEFIPGLTPSSELFGLCELAKAEDHVDVLDSYIEGIALYADHKSPKLCPYLKGHFKTYKFFLEPNGDVSLCDRAAIGNLNDTHIDKMLESDQYTASVEEFDACEGCWLGCFVEPDLRLQRSLKKGIHSNYLIGMEKSEKLIIPPQPTALEPLPILNAVGTEKP